MLKHYFNLGKTVRSFSVTYCRNKSDLLAKIVQHETSVPYNKQTKKYGIEINKDLLIGSIRERNEFLEIYPEIIHDILPVDENFSDISQRLDKVLDYVKTSRLNRGVLLYIGHKDWTKNESFVEENDYKLAKVLGWCLELIESYFIIIDDMVDLSTTRRGMPCWYRFPGHGVHSIYDSILLETLSFKVLQKYFKEHPAYVPCMELLHSINRTMHEGQRMSFLTDISLFTEDFHKNTVKRKTEYIMYYQPLALAMFVARKFDEQLRIELEEITHEIGYLFQLQNDMYDTFGNDHQTGKSACDITQGTCTWLIVQALKRAGPAQRQILHNCYGLGKDEGNSTNASDHSSIVHNNRIIDGRNAVIQIYQDLKLIDISREVKQQGYNRLRQRIEETADRLPAQVLMKCLHHACTDLLDNVKIEMDEKNTDKTS